MSSGDETDYVDIENIEAEDKEKRTLSDSGKHSLLSHLAEDDFSFVWNTSHELHSNKNTVSIAWSKLADTLRSEGYAVETPKLLRKQYNSLRSQFSRITASELRTTGAGLHERKPTWKFYEQMASLTKTETGRRLTNVEKESREESQVVYTSSDTNDPEAQYGSQDVVSLDDLQQPGPSSRPPSAACSSQNQNFKPASKRKMEREDSSAALLQTVDKYIKNKKPKTYAAYVASTFAALCDELDANYPGESKKACTKVLKIIHETTSKFSE